MGVDADLLCWWLGERQCDSGGMGGRPEKQADVCYSWWILSSLSILGKVDWINVDKLAGFILKAQDDEDGGIADRPGDIVEKLNLKGQILPIPKDGVMDDRLHMYDVY